MIAEPNKDKIPKLNMIILILLENISLMGGGSSEFEDVSDSDPSDTGNLTVPGGGSVSFNQTAPAIAPSKGKAPAIRHGRR